MGLILKDRNGNLLIRPVTHPATDAQVRQQLEDLIEEGKITGAGSSSDDVASSSAVQALQTRVQALENQLNVIYEETTGDDSSYEDLLCEKIIEMIDGRNEEY